MPTPVITVAIPSAIWMPSVAWIAIELCPVGGRIVPVPVAVDVHTCAVGRQITAGRHLVHAGERRAIRGMHHPAVQIEHRLVVPPQRHAEFFQRLHLRGDVARAVVEGVLERLDAEPITAGEKRAVVFVPDRERKLAPQLMEACRAEVFVEVQRNLAVRPGAERVAARLEFEADPLEVVELAVGRDVQPAVFIRDWLLAGGEVDDAQARVAQTRPAVPGDPRAFGVRPAVPEGPPPEQSTAP